MRRLGLLIFLCLSASRVWSDETVLFCYNWSCAAEARVSFSEPLLRYFGRSLDKAAGPEDERRRLAQVIGRMYLQAARQSPIAADRAGNDQDGDSYGRMDCIDHSTTTTRLLKLLERRGALRWHRVLEPVRRQRFIVTQHFSAQVETLALARLADVGGAVASTAAQRFVIDSWFVDPGLPAVVLPLQRWMDGEGPDVDQQNESGE